MIIFVYGDLVENEVRLPLVSQPSRGCRKRWLWSVVTIVNILLRDGFKECIKGYVHYKVLRGCHLVHFLDLQLLSINFNTEICVSLANI